MRTDIRNIFGKYNISFQAVEGFLLFFFPLHDLKIIRVKGRIKHSKKPHYTKNDGFLIKTKGLYRHIFFSYRLTIRTFGRSADVARVFIIHPLEILWQSN